MFGLFKKPSKAKTAAVDLYETVVTQARKPAFYLDLGVPDTPDGRYDMIMVHAFLVMHRLKRDHDEATETTQALFDLMFEDMDKNLREMGAGDIGVSHRIKDMAKAFYGRIAVYENGLNEAPGSLEAAIERNVFRKSESVDGQIKAMADYMRRQVAVLGGQITAHLLSGQIEFEDPISVRPVDGSNLEARH